MRLLLDTNIISDIVRNPGGDAAAQLAVLKTGEAGTSIIAAAELRFGYVRVSSKRLESLIETILANMEVVGWETPADMAYAELRTVLEKQGVSVGQNDMLIAAHAWALDATLVTNDRIFSRVPGLKTENWLRQ